MDFLLSVFTAFLAAIQVEMNNDLLAEVIPVTKLFWKGIEFPAESFTDEVFISNSHFRDDHVFIIHPSL